MWRCISRALGRVWVMILMEYVINTRRPAINNTKFCLCVLSFPPSSDQQVDGSSGQKTRVRQDFRSQTKRFPVSYFLWWLNRPENLFAPPFFTAEAERKTGKICPPGGQIDQVNESILGNQTISGLKPRVCTVWSPGRKKKPDNYFLFFTSVPPSPRLLNIDTEQPSSAQTLFIFF